jgi:MYXO-CTERM domain-containing protein
MNGIGQCSGAMCHSDADCRPPLPHCDLSAGPDGRCVQCLFDTDCDAPLVCDPTKKRCQECVPGSANTNQCQPEQAGAQCLADGRCGCLADRDCGGVKSGRVCDGTTSRCVPGCRGTGGNGCPSEQVCSSMTDEVGRCDQAPPPDGGADGSTDGPQTDGGGDADSGAPDARDAGAVDALDGAPVADAGTDADAPPLDAGSGSDGPDAGTDDLGLDRFIAGGGCHCATASDTFDPPWLAVLLTLAAILRRRRR